MVFLRKMMEIITFGVILLFLTLNCSVSSPAPNKLQHDSIHLTASQGTEELEDKEIFEIANKDYETVHGRILAVNAAHQRKREASRNKTDEGNVFSNIEKVNIEEKHLELYQGDIILDPELKKMIEENKRGAFKRNAIRAKKRLWMTRIIPYYVPRHMSHIRSNLMKAINQFHRHTCLRFVRYKGRHRNYITFDNRNGCSSRVGIRYLEAGRQTISLGSGCNFVGTILHELTHAIGFFHEQARPDRDRYVEIKWENILKGYADQFDKYSWLTIDDLGKNYDFKSVMHYGRKAFSKNGQPTIVAVHNPNMEFGTPGDLFSPLDIIEINALYDCKRKRFGWSQWSDFTPCDDKCYRFRERFCYHSGNIRSCGGNVNAYGIEKQSEKCPKGTCPAPINGHWGRWSSWYKCNAKCDNGIRFRSRRCNNPKPKHGGKYCIGPNRTNEVCVLKRCRLDFDDADFENFRLGMWKNVQNDELQWQFHTFFTKTMDTGPSSDHTTGKGYYLYVESSVFVKRKGNAKLVSPWLSAVAGGQCIKFWYSIYGRTMGKLWVKLEIQGGASYLVFYKKGNQGRGWKYGVGSIDTDGKKYRLTIEATLGGKGYSDIAIDDVYIDPGLCSCQDKYVVCAKWGKRGECLKNPRWMAKHCKRTCKKCSAPKPKPCIDKEPKKCPLWAKNKECDKSPGYMRKNCAKSCKICIATPKPCADKKPKLCPVWAKKGECTKNPAYMKPNCAKSCKQCVVSSTACKDKKPQKCPLWAKSGECTKNPGYMKPNCAKSCKICKGN